MPVELAALSIVAKYDKEGRAGGEERGKTKTDVRSMDMKQNRMFSRVVLKSCVGAKAVK